MKHTVVTSEVDYALEAMNLLIRIGSKDDYAGLFKKLERKLSYPSNIFYEKEALLKKIEAEAISDLSGYEDDIAYYFGKKYEEGFNVGGIALLWNDYLTSGKIDFSEYKKQISEMDRKDFIHKYSEHLDNYRAIIFEIHHENIAITEMDVIKQIMQMEISNEEKYRLQSVFIYPDVHRQKVIELIDIASCSIRKYQKEIQAVSNDFKVYWERFFEENELISYLRSRLGIELDDEERRAIIRPAIIIPSSVNLFDDNQKGEESLYLINLGILFGDEFDLSSKVKKQSAEDDVIKSLKLLSDKSKFEILSYIKDNRSYGSELAKHFTLTNATISHHMSALLNAGLVILEKEENRVFYRSNVEAVEELLEYCKEKLI